ncbi:poly-gamma-glutamate biosynthesis protein PgsC [Leptospira weilii serovar Ranarum str. ICFT]|uniref:Poly-gamma-glutamate biosynthesis protein PgsC n=1 Tax=Leptospira weilii serovar Ranarum str. ICFT TaxID=1218598 RepID=N1WHD8_9LEPT|nr:poly-gamma-glutamate biosynthesis protein PgsC [Leptospira weilii]EMY79686.1 poly-gamma-glutamate biosynthesis protein PgsC [Leptospira weilii serovar Ranarum str. ICFT]
METLTLSIGVGILFGFFLWEKTGLQPGGWVVPGYVALFWRKPWIIAALVLSSILTLLIYRVSESRFLSFGQRRTAFVFILSILISLTINRLAEIFLGNMSDFEYKTIGHIVPGLVALSAERQGIAKTFSAILVCSILVRFFLIFALGEVLVL